MALEGAYIVPHPPLIVPEIGRGEQLKISKTIDAYNEVANQISIIKPDTIIVISPHSTSYSDYIHIASGEEASGSFIRFGAPSVKMHVKYDQDLIKMISLKANHELISAGTLGEQNESLDHGVMVPLYFINQKYHDYKLVRISISNLSSLVHYRLGKCIAQAIKESNKKVIIVASGDLSHKLREDGPYGLSPDGPIFDHEVTSAMSKGDFLQFLSFDADFCESAAECGLRSFIITAGALDGKAVKSKLLSYEGPFGVGYGVASFYITGDDNTRCFDTIFEQLEQKRLDAIKIKEDKYVRLARQSVEHYVKTHKYLHRPNNLDGELINQRAGVFVSLKKDGILRGCIGTINACTDCIADEIINNGVSACSFDPRFEPVTEDELDSLVYSVDVLGSAESIQSINELDTKRYGVIVRASRNRCGLLLPNLEGIDTPSQQVSIALRKGNIEQNEKYTLERFEVVRHK